jgi:hypothetical protein
MKKRKLKPKTYDIVAEAVEQGIDWGIRRAHKHTDTPDMDTVRGHIHDNIMSQLCEVIDFGEEE